MIKLYTAKTKDGKVELSQGLTLTNGEYHSEPNGYGSIAFEPNNLEQVLYIREKPTTSFIHDLVNVEHDHGYIKNVKFTNCLDKAALTKLLRTTEKEHDKPLGTLSSDDYKKFGLAEEAIFLFTEDTEVRFHGNQGKPMRIFALHPRTCMIIMQAGAQIELAGPNEPLNTYEVFQSKGKTRELQFVKLDRHIRIDEEVQ